MESSIFCALLICPYSKASTHRGQHLQSLFGLVMHTVFLSFRISFWNSFGWLQLLGNQCEASCIFFPGAAFSSTLSKSLQASAAVSALSDWSKGMSWTGSRVLSCLLRNNSLWGTRQGKDYKADSIPAMRLCSIFSKCSWVPKHLSQLWIRTGNQGSSWLADVDQICQLRVAQFGNYYISQWQ